MSENKEPTVLVALDGSTQALAAMPVARRMAELYGATLHVVHAGKNSLPPCDALSKLGFSLEEVDELVFDHLDAAPSAEGKGIVRQAEEWQSQLIVMCTHTKTERPTGHLGAVAGEVLRTAGCPILFVQPERELKPWCLRRVLFPHDGSPATAEAICPAMELAHRAGAELDVIHVISAAACKGRPEPGSFDVPRYMDQTQHGWPAWTSEFLGRLRGLGHLPAEIKMRLFMAKGKPGEEIVRFASEQRCDLIVLAWHGCLEKEKAATIKEVIRHAPCPVMILRVALPV